jgi:hypothetical protein
VHGEEECQEGTQGQGGWQVQGGTGNQGQGQWRRKLGWGKEYEEEVMLGGEEEAFGGTGPYQGRDWQCACK